MMVAELLRPAPVSVGRRPDILHVHVAFLVQVTQDALEAGKRLGDVAGFSSLVLVSSVILISR